MCRGMGCQFVSYSSVRSASGLDQAATSAAQHEQGAIVRLALERSPVPALRACLPSGWSGEAVAFETMLCGRNRCLPGNGPDPKGGPGPPT
jgi:hypothetical protein